MDSKRRREIWHPPEYDVADIRAIQAFAAGTANNEEQVRAFRWIVEKACATFDEPFRPAQSDVRDYMLGRRSVGLAVIKLMKLRPDLYNSKRR